MKNVIFALVMKHASNLHALLKQIQSTKGLESRLEVADSYAGEVIKRGGLGTPILLLICTLASFWFAYSYWDIDTQLAGFLMISGIALLTGLVDRHRMLELNIVLTACYGRALAVKFSTYDEIDKIVNQETKTTGSYCMKLEAALVLKKKEAQDEESRGDE